MVFGTVPAVAFLGFLAVTPQSTTRTHLIPQRPHPLQGAPSLHQDDDGNCVFGLKSYWDERYQQQQQQDDKQSSSDYSWYCGWTELQPFWSWLVPKQTARVLIAGMGNDPCPVELYRAGWNHSLTAFDYSQAAVQRAQQLFGKHQNVKLVTADARDLPFADAAFDATLDKGTLDAIYITGKQAFYDAVHELGRVTAQHGVVVSISAVVPPDQLLEAFDSDLWENCHDGSLAFAPDGEATIDLGADFYSWRRTNVPFQRP